jgi:hypothetical protein
MPVDRSNTALAPVSEALVAPANVPAPVNCSVPLVTVVWPV